MVLTECHQVKQDHMGAAGHLQASRQDGGKVVMATAVASACDRAQTPCHHISVACMLTGVAQHSLIHARDQR